MTVDELLAEARQLVGLNVNAYVHPDAMRTARAILDLLGTPAPCGWPEPVVKGPGSLWWEALGMLLSSDEARAIAVMLLRAADEAEGWK